MGIDAHTATAGSYVCTRGEAPETEARGAADEPFPETPKELEESIQWYEPGEEEWLLKKVCLRHK